MTTKESVEQTEFILLEALVNLCANENNTPHPCMRSVVENH